MERNMSHFPISFINQSTVVTDAEVQAAMAALQKQVSEDFASVWGIDADLSFVEQGSQPAAGQWWLVILDTSDQAGALGYHDLTPEGLPLGKVFAKTDADYNELWTVTASHELLEMLADPDIDLCAIDQSNSHLARLYAYEVCDPCQADDAGYQIDGITVSDFVYPTWFESFWNGSSEKQQFDRNGLLSAPFQLYKGGYCSVMDVGSLQGWTEVFGSDEPAFSVRPPIGTRRERRHIARSQWLRSNCRFENAAGFTPC